ncbi:MAG: DUF2064 domain-containing protein [Eggerthellaceae bacterium]|nr:DUF2064 domain-containing protein [Eggerthellaceae bacterium]
MEPENSDIVRKRRNALLVFSKPPLPGLVKTRLTPIKDGIFSPEVAAALYHCMLFDVIEICCDALTELEQAQGESNSASAEESPRHRFDSYELFISTTPLENIEAMRKLFEDSGTWPREIRFIGDAGASFDEHYNDAFNQLWARGFDSILSLGADMPALPRSVIVEGFQMLQRIDDQDHRGECETDSSTGARGGMVLSPDQEMGVSLVGWTAQTDMDHSGVFYNSEGLTVLPAYIEKARKRGLPVFWLPAVPDIDTMADLAHNITLLQAIEYSAQFQGLSLPWRSIDALRQIEYFEVRVPPNELRDSREGIDEKL